MANTTNPSQQSRTSPSDRESSPVQDSTSSPPVSPTPAEVARKITRLTLEEYTARNKPQTAVPHTSTPKSAHSTLPPFERSQTVYRGGAQECSYASLDAFDVEVEEGIDHDINDINDNLLSPKQVSNEYNYGLMWLFGVLSRPAPSLWIRRKNNELGSANKLANWTSNYGSTVLLDDVSRPATATSNRIMTSHSALENNTLVHVPIKTSDYTLENYMPLPTPNETSTRTLENNVLVPAPSKIFSHTLELEDGALVPATTHTTPVVNFDPPFRLLDLARELRDEIYSYLTPDDAFWFARPPVIGNQKNAVFERNSLRKPATLNQIQPQLDVRVQTNKG
jgi:hypothetical protein